MKFKIKSTDPKSHLIACSSINFFKPHIIDAGIIPVGGEEIYGFFLLDGSPDMIESLYHFPGINLEIYGEFLESGDI